MSNPFKNIPRPTVEELSPETQKAIQAAERVAKKLRERKRKLGQKLYVNVDGEMQLVDP